MNAKLTKLEQFVYNNPQASFLELAKQLNRTVSQCEAAYDRAKRKLRGTPGHYFIN